MQHLLVYSTMQHSLTAPSATGGGGLGAFMLAPNLSVGTDAYSRSPVSPTPQMPLGASAGRYVDELKAQDLADLFHMVNMARRRRCRPSAHCMQLPVLPFMPTGWDALHANGMG